MSQFWLHCVRCIVSGDFDLTKNLLGSGSALVFLLGKRNKYEPATNKKKKFSKCLFVGYLEDRMVDRDKFCRIARDWSAPEIN